MRYAAFIVFFSVVAWADCGDGLCEASESCGDCAIDCGSCCGDGTCGSAENCGNCAADCGNCQESCPNIDKNPSVCNTTVTCDDTSCFEKRVCPPVETSVCGDEVCQAELGEDGVNCPGDCGYSVAAICGNGTCEEGLEDCMNCSQDCNVCPQNPTCDGISGLPKTGFKYPFLKNVWPNLKTPDFLPVRLVLTTALNVTPKGTLTLVKNSAKGDVNVVASATTCLEQTLLLGGVPSAYCLTGTAVGAGSCSSKLVCAELAPLYQPLIDTTCCQINAQVQLGGTVKLGPLYFPEKQSLVRCELEGSTSLLGYVGGVQVQAGFCPTKFNGPNSAGVKLKGNIEGSCFVAYAGQKYGVGAEGGVASCLGVPPGFLGFPAGWGYNYEYGVAPIKIGWFRIGDWRYSSTQGILCTL